jgi:hypothetical protein
VFLKDIKDTSLCNGSSALFGCRDYCAFVFHDPEFLDIGKMSGLFNLKKEWSAHSFLFLSLVKNAVINLSLGGSFWCPLLTTEISSREKVIQ